MGMTAKDLQNAVKVQRTGNPWVLTIDPKLIGSTGANFDYLVPNTNPGAWGSYYFIQGPGWYNIDLQVTKAVKIRESLRTSLQASFLNLLNHPNFGMGSTSIRSLSFGQTSGASSNPGARQIELRANVEF